MQSTLKSLKNVSFVHVNENLVVTINDLIFPMS